MEAAAHGKSNLGISPKVGQEFAEADKGKKFANDDGPVAAGTIFCAPDNAVLLLLRSPHEPNYANHWALPGGKGEPGETALEASIREAGEELGTGYTHALLGEPTQVATDTTTTSFTFTTFLQPVRYRFVPELNAEHSGYAWFMPNALPTPIHPSVAATLAKTNPPPDVLAVAEIDPSLVSGTFEVGDQATDERIALDEASTRRFDPDGHLHVERTNISKAVVNPYYGREIPGWENLHLERDKIYKLYRDPDELAKAAPTFAGKPLLVQHTAVSADSHPKDVVVGAIGQDVAFEAPYLTAPLTVWEGEAIKDIESGKQRELSCGYHYDPDMTPGSVDGQDYDGVMRNIRGNHVALVVEGRAGPDVLVGDEMPAMSTTPNSGVPAMAGKAKDDLPKKDKEMPKNALDDAKEFLKGKLSAEDMKTYDEMCTGAKDDDLEDTETGEDEELDDKDKDKDKANDADPDEKDDDKVSKGAMDAAINAAVRGTEKRVAEQVRKTERAIRVAERDVQPYVGELQMTFDSASAVYRHALKALEVPEADTIHDSALKTVLLMQPKAGSKETVVRKEEPTVAMDAAAKDLAHKYAPGLAGITIGV